MADYRVQPILDASSLELKALEVLCTTSLAFDDIEEMIVIDIGALRYASKLARETGLRVHCNMELSTLILANNIISCTISPGVVIELVERHEILKNTNTTQDIYKWIKESAVNIRTHGGIIAMDDVTLNELEFNMIDLLKPEILKVENRASLIGVSAKFNDKLIISERIETQRHAELARRLGAHELQGFWCDRQASLALGRIFEEIEAA